MPRAPVVHACFVSTVLTLSTKDKYMLSLEVISDGGFIACMCQWNV